MRLFAIIALIIMPQQLSAECHNDVITDAINVRIDATAVDRIAKSLPTQIPESIPLPEFTITIADAPAGFDNIELIPKNGLLFLDLSEFDLWLSNQSFHIQGKTDIEIRANLDVVLTALPNAECPANFTSTGIDFSADINVVMENCEPNLVVENLVFDIPEETTELELYDCGIYDNIFNTIYKAFKNQLIADAEEAIDDMVNETLPSWIKSFTSEMLGNEFSFYSFDLLFDVENLYVDNYGIELNFNAAANTNVMPADCLPSNAILPSVPYTTEAFSFSSTPVSIVLSRAFMQQVINVAWFSGFLCFDSNQLGLDINEYSSIVLPNADVSFSVQPQSPPDLHFNAGDLSDTMAIVLDHLQAIIHLDFNTGEHRDLLTDIGAAIFGNIKIHNDMQALTFMPTGIDANQVILNLNENNIMLSESALENIIQQVLMPLMKTNLGNLQLTSSLFATAPLLILMDDVYTTEEYMYLDIDLWPIHPEDTIPPRTILKEELSYSMAPNDSIAFSSKDNDCPEHFLRHQIFLDDDKQPIAVGGQTVQLKNLPAGSHTLIMKALDASGNVDESPLTHDVLVDANPPSIDILSAPAALSNDKIVKIEFMVNDDLSPKNKIKVAYLVYQLDKWGGAETLIADGDLTNQTILSLSNLSEDTTYRVGIYARDTVGNISSVMHTFAINRKSTFSCQQAPLGAVFPYGLSLLFILFYQRNRWRFK